MSNKNFQNKHVWNFLPCISKMIYIKENRVLYKRTKSQQLWYMTILDKFSTQREGGREKNPHIPGITSAI